MLLAAFLILATALAALAAVVGVITIAVRSRVLPGPSLVAKEVVIQTVRPNSETIRGVLISAHADRWVIADPFYVEPDGEKPLGGRLHVPVGRIAYVQEIEPKLAA
jgi:hypothetical protein